METIIMNITAHYLPVFLLVLLRTGLAVAFLPFFSSKMFLGYFKIGFAVALAAVITPVVNFPLPPRPEIAVAVIREVVLGAALGFAGQLVFFGIEMAAQLINMSMGLSLATVFDPQMGETTELSTFFTMLSMLLFLAVNAHHEVIYIFVKSFEWLPPGGAHIAKVATAVIAMGEKMFVLAVRLSAPIVIAMLAVNLLLGFLYKAAPLLNVFFIGYPVYIMLGFVLILLGLPAFMEVTKSSFGSMSSDMIKVLSAAKG